jgi:hypothetical protein
MSEDGGGVMMVMQGKEGISLKFLITPDLTDMRERSSYAHRLACGRWAFLFCGGVDLSRAGF